MGPWRIFHLPSLALRRQVTNSVYYLGPLVHRVGSHSEVKRGPNIAADQKMFRQTNGWMPENDVRNPISTSECDIPTPHYFDFQKMSKKTYLEEILEAYTSLARNHNATLVVVFQPVACTLGTGAKNAKARAIIDQFKGANPDVEIPFPLIETWPADMFSVPAHVRHEYTDMIGNRLGKAMAGIVTRRGY